MPPEDDDSGFSFNDMDELADNLLGASSDDGAGGGTPAGGGAPTAPAGGQAAPGTGTPQGGAPTGAPAAGQEPWRQVHRSWPENLHPFYAGLPPEVMQWIHGREDAFSRAYKPLKEQVEGWNNIFSPYQDFLQTLGTEIQPQQITKALMDAHLALVYGGDADKKAWAKHLDQQYGISKLLGLAAPGGADPNGGTPPQQLQDPRFDALQQELRGFQARESARVQREKLNEVNAFCADPKNEFAGEVIEQMMELSAIMPKASLSDLYDRAIWANPGVRAKIIQKEIEKATKPPRAGTLNPAPSGGARAPSPPTGRDVKDDIGADMAETYNAIMARAGGR